MKLVYNNILQFIKHIVTTVLFISMLLQTATVAITVFTDSDTELTLIDWEEDSDEEEEIEKANEKIEPPVFNTYYSHFENNSIIIYHIISQKLMNISQEIPIPPPELV